MMKIRHYIFLVSMGLTLLGVIMVFSTTGVYADTQFKNSFFFLGKELVWLSIGMTLLMFGYKINIKFLQNNAVWLYVITLLLVLLTYTPLGVKIGGAQRWIRMGFFNFQPSEFLKFGVACLLSAYLYANPQVIKEFWRGFAFCLFIIFISFASVIGQPDFGTSMMIAVVGVMIMFVAGANLKYLFMLFISSIPLLIYCVVCFPYRMRRVVAFINPWEDPLGKGFQIVQSFLAIGRGHLTGVGLGESTQKLFYLPAAHTDFIFSILAEELGFIGCVAVIVAFLLITILSIVIAYKAGDIFDSLMALSLGSYISMQALFNIAVVTGSVPTKGIPLPFISFGGSSLALNLLAIGLIMNISKRSEILADKKLSQFAATKRKTPLVFNNGRKLARI